jgi:hypothetical protein
MTIKEAAIKWKKFPAQYKGKNEKITCSDWE